MNRNFINIKQILPENLNDKFYFCFTYAIQPSLRIPYIFYDNKRKKERSVNKLFRTVCFKGQKSFLTRGIEQLRDCAYFFEQHTDGRYHLHGFCYDTGINVLNYMKDRYQDTKMTSKTDIQDYCLLVEKVCSPPTWVAYCHKHQTKRDLFKGEIENFVNSRLDTGVVKIEVNENEQIVFKSDEDPYKNYLFGKKFIVEI